ncbi:hypothetical protein O181_123647 [Austropuccinia psidii MF-1]|uniref:Uncharacterized protein n=1 Tax=Austropuccinia psidii MF-1 TaxID=1389203 RepID=A0A9Q3KN38_9BASI|nr:hypothetical protein [Austropuccinia psidii MF-1]
MPRQIQAQLCSEREYERPVILQEIYNQVKNNKKEKLQGRRSIDALIEILKEERFVWSSERDSDGHIPPCFALTPCNNRSPGVRVFINTPTQNLKSADQVSELEFSFSNPHSETCI